MAVVTAPAGARIVDLGGVLTGPQAAALAQDGVWGVLLDLATPGIAPSIESARMNGLHVGVFQGYYPAAFIDPQAADQRAQWALTVLHSADALEPGLTVWLDWEAVPARDTVPAAEAWINAWNAVVVKAQGIAGLYEGANQPLNGQELYAGLTSTRYWRSCSASVPVVFDRGYCLVQTACGQTVAGVGVDLDTAQTDHLGGQATFLTPRVAVQTQTWAPESQVRALTDRVTTLESALRQAGAALKGVGA